MTMRNRKKEKTVQTLMIIIICLTAVESLHSIHAETSSNTQWNLDLQLQNSQNQTLTDFSPFEEIKLIGTVTYGNATQPNVLITFKVENPIGVLNITKVLPTDNQGQAECLIRLPVQSQDENSIVGTWNASAAIQTTNGTLQKDTSFTSQWPLEISALKVQNSLDANQTSFYPNSTVAVKIAIKNFGESKTVNISLDMQDTSGKTINQTVIQNSEIAETATDPTEIQAYIQIPNDTITGQTTIIAAINSGNWQGVDLPVAANKTAFFTVSINGSIPIISPSPTAPPSSENTMSLFSWLAIATGFFTFTSLVLFLKRKSSKVMVNIPDLPQQLPTVELPKIGSSTVIQQGTEDKKSPYRTSAEQVIRAVSIKQESVIDQTTEAYLNKINANAEKIQALKGELKVERNKLGSELEGLMKVIEDKELTIANYFKEIRQQIVKIEPLLKDEATTEPKKQETEDDNKKLE